MADTNEDTKFRARIRAIIEADKEDLNNAIAEFKQMHSEVDPDGCKKYVRNKMINSVSLEDAEIHFYLNECNIVTW